MPIQTKSVQAKIALLALCAASLSLSACGPRLHNGQFQMSNAACAGAAYAPSCAHLGQHAGYYGAQQQIAYQGQLRGQHQGQYYQQSFAQPAYQYPAYSAYPAPSFVPYASLPATTYIPTQQSVVSYMPITTNTPTTVPTPVFEPTPVIEPSPPLTTWAPEPWTPPWRDEPDCPEGTIQGYGGNGCVQVAIPRK